MMVVRYAMTGGRWRLCVNLGAAPLSKPLSLHSSVPLPPPIPGSLPLSQPPSPLRE